jgi:spore maturation protein CgeB
LYCSVDPDMYHPCPEPIAWDLGYLGTYSPDRQPALDSLMLEPARLWPEGRFAVAGPMYPQEIRWPRNVDLTIHLSPHEHPRFYGAQRFTLNITREAMKRAGYSPSVRLFEAGACAAPVISDWWEGLDQLFTPGKEVLISEGPEDTLRYLRDLPEAQRLAIGNAARLRILDAHTPLHRARQLETALREIDDQAAPHTPRRNGFGGQIDHRMDAGLAAQSGGKGASGTVGAEIVAAQDRRNLLESPGASYRDRRADRASAETGSAPLE